MRTADLHVRVGRSRWRVIAVVVVVGLIVLGLLVKAFSGLFVESLWYSSIGQHEVFAKKLETEVGLFLTFGLIFFLAMWVNLLLCNRLAPSEVFLDAPEDELVRRFQGAVRPYAGRLYALVAFVMALVAASSAVGQWQNWLLISNGKSWGVTDPLFHKDIGFYVFDLPFLTFVVDWTLAALLAVIVFTVIFHYLNGGIRAARVSPRVSPGVKVHLSVLVALLALAKAVAYLVARWHIVTSSSANDGIEGGGYTDVHWRLPALMLLFWLCLLVAAILLVNIRQRGWTLPVIAVGLWAFVAFVLGFFVPLIIQAVKVTPSQSTLELPYIRENIAATRAAYGLDHVVTQRFGSTRSSTPLLQRSGVSASLADIRQWDPDPSIALTTFQQLQTRRNYYTISPLGEDRYVIRGRLTPVLIGLRELNTAGVPNGTWVNSHLEYTHGIGAVMIPSNATSGRSPVFTEYDVPPSTAAGYPTVSQTGVYFGLTQSGFVVVHTNQNELDYQIGDSSIRSTHYAGNGGVRMGGFFSRALMAIHFGDLNLLTSNLITSNSRILFVRNPVQIAQQAAPFLSIDAHPYAVIDDGHLDWVMDGYTTTDEYPYSQNADTQDVPTDTSLPGSYNYVRNSVKIVVDAYSGKVWLYAMSPPSYGADPVKHEPADPILATWESIYPGLILPYGRMPTILREHLKYPEDLFSIQAAVFGRYHITTPAAFYTNGDGWSLSPTDGAGPPPQSVLSGSSSKQAPATTPTARMDPLYQVYALPGTKVPVYTLTDAYVTASNASQSTTPTTTASSSSSSSNSSSDSGSTSSTSAVNSQVLNLSAFMVARSDPDDYGELTIYQPPPGVPKQGPVQADSSMNSFSPASTKISLLHIVGSTVLLGAVQMVPLNGSMLYVRPMYVSSTSSAYPHLEYFITAYNASNGFSPNLQTAIEQALGVATGPGTGPNTGRQTATQLLHDAIEFGNKATQALSAGKFALYGRYLTLEAQYQQKAYTELTHPTRTRSSKKAPRV